MAPKTTTPKKLTIFDIFRKHIITLTTALTQLMLINDLSIARLFIMLFSPIINIIIDVVEYFNKPKTAEICDMVNIVPDNHRCIVVSSTYKYGSYENSLYYDVTIYINNIIRNNKNIMPHTQMEIKNINNNASSCITLCNNQFMTFYYNPTDNMLEKKSMNEDITKQIADTNNNIETNENTNIMYIQRNDSNIEVSSNSTTTIYSYSIYGPTKTLIEQFIDRCSEYAKELENNKSTYFLYRYNTNNKSSPSGWEQYTITLRKNFSNTFLSKPMDTFIPTHIHHFLYNEKDYDNKGQSYKTSFLFSGDPGCGKSSIAYAIANEYRKNIYRIDPDFFEDDDFAKRFRSIKNSIILIEEIDTIPLFWKRLNKTQLRVSDNDSDSDSDSDNETDTNSDYYITNTTTSVNKKLTPQTNESSAHNTDNTKNITSTHKSGGNGNGNGNGNGIAASCGMNFKNILGKGISYSGKYMEKTRLAKLQQMLDILDGYCFLSGCIVIATTNHPEKIDPAFTRPGRIDRHFKFGPADDYQIRNIFKYFYNGWQPSDDIIENLLNDKITTSYIINTLIMLNKSSPYDAFLYHSQSHPWLTTEILQTIPQDVSDVSTD